MFYRGALPDRRIAFDVHAPIFLIDLIEHQWFQLRFVIGLSPIALPADSITTSERDNKKNVYPKLNLKKCFGPMLF